MFKFKEISKDFVSVTLNNQPAKFQINNCRLVDPPYIYNAKWYITISLTQDIIKNLQYIQTISPNGSSFQNSIKPNTLLIKCRCKQNQFQTSFFRNKQYISYNQLYNNDFLDSAIICFVGIFKGYMQFTLDEINLK